MAATNWPAPTFTYCPCCRSLQTKHGLECITKQELEQLEREDVVVVEETCQACLTASTTPPQQFAAAGA